MLKCLSLKGLTYFVDKILATVKNKTKQVEYRYTYKVTGSEIIISLQISNFSETNDTVDVYMNGLLMKKETDYTLAPTGIITIMSNEYTNLDEIYVVHRKLEFRF